MPKILVLAGNTFAPTFFGACYAVKTKVGAVEAVHIFDSEESDADAGKQQRSIELRRLLGPVDLNTSIIDTVLATLANDFQLAAMLIYRNLASNNRRLYRFSREDARLALDLTMLILERVAGTDIITDSL